MLPNTSPELTPEQVAQIEQARKLIPKVRKEILKAQQAGINMDAQLAQLNESEAQIDKLYRVYVSRRGSLTGT